MDIVRVGLDQEDQVAEWRHGNMANGDMPVPGASTRGYVGYSRKAVEFSDNVLWSVGP